MKMFQVDAFAGTLFRGNPAAVILRDAALPEARMQAIAAENNLSETAFLSPRGPGWHLRWFTPVREVDFCGHATLAAAHVLAAEYGHSGPMVFATRVGEITVTQEGGGYALDLPLLAPEPVSALPAALAGHPGLEGAALFRNFAKLFAVLPDARAVRRFRPDAARIAALGDGLTGLVVTAPGPDEEADEDTGACDFVSRCFAPAVGVAEDPVTGSTHATLAPYWAARLGRGRLVARQLSARGGELTCTPGAGRVRVEGRAVTYMEARLRLPD